MALVKKCSFVGRICSFALVALAAGCSGSNTTNAVPTPTRPSQTATPSVSATPSADTVVGEWQRAPTCQELVRALTRGGFGDFAAEAVGGAALLTTPENVPAKDPKHPCADAAGPIEHSHKFWEDGTFNSYNQVGQQVDDGKYKIIDSNSILFAGFQVDYKIADDTIVFSFAVPKSCTSQECRRRAAYAINVFYPGKAWMRVS
jgi:hypothetical protein